MPENSSSPIGPLVADLPDDALLTTAQLASRIKNVLGRCTPSTIDKWRSRGQGPKPIKFGDGERPRIRYPVKWINEWWSDYTRTGSPGTSTPGKTPDAA